MPPSGGPSAALRPASFEKPAKITPGKFTRQLSRSQTMASRRTLELFAHNTAAELQVQEQIALAKRKVVLLLAEREKEKEVPGVRSDRRHARSLKFNSKSKTAVSATYREERHPLLLSAMHHRTVR